MEDLIKLVQKINADVDLSKVRGVFDGYSKEQLALVVKVLQSEINQSFFKLSHRDDVINEIASFNYRVSTDVAVLLGLLYPLQSFDLKEDKLFGLTSNDIESYHKTMEQDGLVVFDKLLSDDFCNNIIKKLKDVTFETKGASQIIQGYKEENIFTVKGNTSWVSDQQDIMKIEEVQELAYNPSILSIVQSYLKAQAIHCQSSCWWSINYKNDSKELSKNAQQYHQDKEFIKFVKVFIYLNDVTEENGPHAYVKGSAKDYEQFVPKDYLVSSRISDEFIAENYDKDRIVYLSGKKGSVIIEDTNGFHKGVEVQKGHRLLLQLEYCCSMYFNPVTSFSFEGLNQNSLKLAAKYPRVFLNYNNERYAKRNDTTFQMELNKYIRKVKYSRYFKFLFK